MEEYTKSYYKAINNEELDQAKMLSRVLTELYNPKSVVDLGCGTGLYLAQFKCERKGYDFSTSAFDPEVRQLPENEMFLADLRLIDEQWGDRKFDLTICLEVVEHIGCEFADNVVDNIVKTSNTIVMTASPPGQAGLNHVNCQPQKYWDEKFEKLGFYRDYHDEYQIISKIHQVPHTVWLIRNLMVYKKYEI